MLAECTRSDLSVADFIGRVTESRFVIEYDAERDVGRASGVGRWSEAEPASVIPADECAKKMLLDAFTANGLLIERAGAHGTESSAAELLSTGRPGSALPMIIHNANVGGGGRATCSLVQDFWHDKI